MIKILKRGIYELGETDNFIKILSLDNVRKFIWVNTKKVLSMGNGETNLVRKTFAQGYYYYYIVQNELDLTPGQHLEIALGQNLWQGYILPEGLPQKKQQKKQIIPTDERITASRAGSF